MSKQPQQHGFLGTTGLAIMMCSGTFIAGFLLWILYKVSQGLGMEQATPMLGTLFTGGVLPYFAGFLLFCWGKKTQRPRR